MGVKKYVIAFLALGIVLPVLLTTAVLFYAPPIIENAVRSIDLSQTSLTIQNQDTARVHRKGLGLEMKLRATYNNKNIELILQIDPLHLVLQGRAIAQLTIDGLEITIERKNSTTFLIDNTYEVSIEGSESNLLAQVSTLPFQVDATNATINYIDSANAITYTLKPSLTNVRNFNNSLTVSLSSFLYLNGKNQVSIVVDLDKNNGSVRKFSMYGYQLPVKDVVASFGAHDYAAGFEYDPYLNVILNGTISNENLTMRGKLFLTNLNENAKIHLDVLLRYDDEFAEVIIPTIELTRLGDSLISISNFHAIFVANEGFAPLKLHMGELVVKPFDISRLEVLNAYIDPILLSTFRGDVVATDLKYDRRVNNHSITSFSGDIAVTSVSLPSYFQLQNIKLFFRSVPGEIIMTFLGKEVSLEVFELFTHGYYADSINGAMRIKISDDEYNITSNLLKLIIENQQMFGFMELTHKRNFSPYMKLLLSSPGFAGPLGISLIPSEILNPDLVTWLQKSILSGHMYDFLLNFQGNLLYSLPSAGPEILDIGFEIGKADVLYDTKWPKIHIAEGTMHFSDNKLNILFTEAYYNSVHFAGEVKMSDFKNLYLHSKIAFKGDANDVEQFLIHSPLHERFSGLANISDFSGHVSGFVDFSTPLENVNIDQVSFSGHAYLQLDSYMVMQKKHNIVDLHGLLYFDDETIYSESLVGMFEGNPISATISTLGSEANPIIKIDIDVLASLQDAIHNHGLLQVLEVEGKAKMNVVINTPLRSNENTFTTLHLVSDGVGIQINQNNQLNKTKDQAQNLSITAMFKSDSVDIDLLFERVVDGSLQLAILDDQIVLKSGSLHFGDISKKATIRNDQMTVSFNVAYLDLDPWIEYFTVDKENNFSYLSFMTDVTADKLKYKSVLINEATIVVEKNLDTPLVMSLSSSEIVGKATYSDGDPHPLSFDIEKMILGLRNFNSPVRSQVTPNDIPAITLTCSYCQVNEKIFHNLQLQTSTVSMGMNFDFTSFLKEPEYSINGMITWTYSPTANSHNTTLTLTSESINVERTFNDIGFPQLMSEGEGSVKASLNWNGPPYNMVYDNLSGNIVFDLEDGGLKFVDSTESSHVFSLLNLTQLPRRLIFDFEDVSGDENEMPFSSIKSTFKVKTGVAQTIKTEVAGSFGSILLSGKLDFKTSMIDMRSLAIPKISSALPVISGLLGGLPWLFGTLIVGEVVNESGFDINTLGAIQYKLLGTFSNPTIERIEKK